MAITAINITVATVDLIGLNNAERKALPKIDMNNMVFVVDAPTAINNNGGILLTCINAVEIGKDLPLIPNN